MPTAPHTRDPGAYAKRVSGAYSGTKQRGLIPEAIRMNTRLLLLMMMYVKVAAVLNIGAVPTAPAGPPHWAAEIYDARFDCTGFSLQQTQDWCLADTPITVFVSQMIAFGGCDDRDTA